MRRGMRRRERITNVSLSSSLPPAFLPLPSPFPFCVQRRSLAHERHRTLSSGRRFYLRGNSKGDGQLRHRRCSLTGRRRDATTRRLKPRLRRSEFLHRTPTLVPSKPPNRARRLCLAFFSLSASRFPLLLFPFACRRPAFPHVSQLAREISR